MTTRKLNERIARLMPGGIPRYIRVYDNGGKTYDQYTVIYSGRWPGRQPNTTYGVGMSEHPYHPQGYGQHFEAPTWGNHRQGEKDNGFIPKWEKKQGKKIPFEMLPYECQCLVLNDYADYWDLNDPVRAERKYGTP